MPNVEQTPVETSVPARTEPRALDVGAVSAVIVLHAVTLVAAYTRTDPYPPLALVPFIAANLAAGVAALPALGRGQRSGDVLTVVFATWSLVSFGPHKLLTDDIPEILPAVLIGFLFSVIALLRAVRRLRDNRGHGSV